MNLSTIERYGKQSLSICNPKLPPPPPRSTPTLDNGKKISVRSVSALVKYLECFQPDEVCITWCLENVDLSRTPCGASVCTPLPLPDITESLAQVPWIFMQTANVSVSPIFSTPPAPFDPARSL